METSVLSGNPEYDAFVEKFKRKKTTDDCYTPTNIYDVVANWVAQEYGLDQNGFVRPFWPNTEFEQFDYPAGCIVVDNPPFSIRARIVDFYTLKGIRYFLFSPALVLLKQDYVCHIATGANITYENGAVVPTSFITNLETCVLRTAPDLYQAIKLANQDNLKAIHKQLPKYAYPDHIVTLAIAQRWSHYGIDYRLDPEDCTHVNALDSQRAKKKKNFRRRPPAV